MADPAKRLPENCAGEFFVDSTCIDCDTCRQLAPATFADSGAASYVHTQPDGPAQRRDALRALVSCPTASIGARGLRDAREVVDDFPLRLDRDLFYCGFASPKSYGGSSYFLRHAEGNWLIDSPRYVEALVRKFEAMGGIRHIFLTHRDDVAEAEKYARRFGAERIIHRLEASAQPGAERILDSMSPVELAPDFLAIPTPGHTRGHTALLFEERVLFTGDHLWWNRERGSLSASRSVCWYSWTKQIASMAGLRRYSFEWVLPGHGERIRLPRERMAREIEALVSRMRAAA